MALLTHVRVPGGVIVALSLILCAWVALSPRISPGLYRDRLFHPEQQRGDNSALRSFNAVTNGEVFFTAVDGSRLHGWFFFNQRSKYILIVCPGNAGDIAGRLDFIKTLLRTGASVFIYEPRGFGMSSGKPSISSICLDGLSAYDFVKSFLRLQSDQIVLYGVSLGASVATYVSQRRPAKALIVQSGFSSLPRIAHDLVPFLRIYPPWLFPSRLDNAETLKAPHPPLLILHGLLDDVVPVQHCVSIYRGAAEPKSCVIFPNSGHAAIDPRDENYFVQSIADFLTRLH